jgi:hypothetical protein
MPNPLQLAVFAREFDDVIQFTHPPRVVQRLLFGLLTPLGCWATARATPEYLARAPSGFFPVEPMDVAAALAEFSPASSPNTLTPLLSRHTAEFSRIRA